MILKIFEFSKSPGALEFYFPKTEQCIHEYPSGLNNIFQRFCQDMCPQRAIFDSENVIIIIIGILYQTQIVFAYLMILLIHIKFYLKINNVCKDANGRNIKM